jgi:hypothetical protein
LRKEKDTGVDMSKMLSSDLIIETIQAGCNEAFNAYRDVSRGYWLSHAPETFIQSSILFEFLKLQRSGKPAYVTLETSPKKIERYCGEKPDRRKVKMSQAGRFDMLIWYKNGHPFSIIEIKKAWDNKACDKDACRIQQWISSNNSIESGYLVVYTEAKGLKADMKLSERLKCIEINTASTLRKVLPDEREVDGNGWQWRIGIYHLKR